MIDLDCVEHRQRAIAPHLDERQRRLLAAAEARAAGRGGIAAVSRATGIAASTIGRGLKDLGAPVSLSRGGIRRLGGGRKSLVARDPRLLDDLNKLVEPDARGDPMSPLRWTCKSLRKLSQSLRDMGTRSGARSSANSCAGSATVCRPIARRRARAQTIPDATRSFATSAVASRTLTLSEPAISVDTKKRELVGDFKNAGREWREKDSPEDVRVHDFVIPDGRAVPYGVYDIADAVGRVSAGVDHDTGAFAVNAIRSWWTKMGCARYPNAKSLLITADGGGPL